MNKGMSVNMNGLQIGALENMKLDGNNNIAVKISIFEEHAKRIRKGSVLRLVAPIFGSKSLEIIPGNINLAAIPDNGYVASYDSEDGKKILAEKMEGLQLSPTENILLNVSDLTKRLNDPNGPLFANLENFKVISKNISKLSEKIMDNEGRMSLEEITINVAALLLFVSVLIILA